MKLFFKLFTLFILYSSVYGQEGFLFTKNKKKAIIPFKLINSLVIVPIKINGVELDFLLDTGVEETILFSLENSEKEVQLFNSEKIKLRGLGSKEAIDGLKSTNNTLSVNSLENRDQVIYIILDESFNFSSSLGIPVNGIIGSHFFENNLVEIDYSTKKIIVYNEKKINREKLFKRFTSFDISIENNKPYIISNVAINENPFEAKLLLDTGNTGAIWLFPNQSKNIFIPKKNLDDYLGRGFSGDIYGKKARISKLSMGKFELNNLITSFPDTTSIHSIKMVKDRVGSVGGEVLMRFSTIFDYVNNKLYLKKNNNYDQPFHFDMSGIEIHHTGLQWVQETVNMQTAEGKTSYGTNAGQQIYGFQYKFELKPTYEIITIRKDSPAELAGLKKGDIIHSVNNMRAYKYSLQEINSLLKSEEGKTIEVEVERKNVLLNFKFKLKSVL